MSQSSYIEMRKDLMQSTAHVGEFLKIILPYQIYNINRDYYVPLPPIEEERHIALHLPVGRSVDQTMSAQYLENLLLDCYDISYVGWL